MQAGILALDDASQDLLHQGLGTGVQVSPPSFVSKLLVFRAFQMVAWSASVARTPPRSSESGEWINFQWAAPSVASRMAPARPPIQQTCSDGAEPVSRSASTPLVWRAPEAAPSLASSVQPARPA